MKKIPLFRLEKVTVGYARVSNADYARLKKVDWFACWDGPNRYARSSTGRKTILMHQSIIPSKGQHVHHIDGDGWNNQRKNLSPLTPLVHSWVPKRKRANSTSKFVGVHWHKQHGKWVAQLKRHGRTVFTRLFNTQVAARRAYLQALRGYHAQ